MDQRKRSSAHRLFRLAQALHAFDVARIERGFVPDGVLLPPIAFVGTDRAHQGRIETVVQRDHNSNALKFRLSHGSSGCLDGNLPSVTSSYRFRTLSRTFTRSVAMSGLLRTASCRRCNANCKSSASFRRSSRSPFITLRRFLFPCERAVRGGSQ